MRPWRGFPPEEALKHWSDQPLYSAMLDYSDASRPVSMAKGHPPSERVLRYQEYARRRSAIEAPFLEKLKSAELLASGILIGHREREIVEPSLWEEIKINFGLEELIGYKIRYLRPEFFEPTAIPLNIHEVPHWLEGYIGYRPSLDALQFDPGFRHVALRGRSYTLGEIQGCVIKLLYQAAAAGSQWVNGKILLHEAGSELTKVSDLFKRTKDWEQLIESDGRGMYRLKLD
jgi:hypothetical protein